MQRQHPRDDRRPEQLPGPSQHRANGISNGRHRAAIVARSGALLGAVKTEFRKFGDVLARAQKKLQEASNTIDEARGKTTTIARKLREVEGLPESEADRLLTGGEESGRLFEDDVASPPSQAPAL